MLFFHKFGELREQTKKHNYMNTKRDHSAMQHPMTQIHCGIFFFLILA